jgi:hypothetical protein
MIYFGCFYAALLDSVLPPEFGVECRYPRMPGMEAYSMPKTDPSLGFLLASMEQLPQVYMSGVWLGSHLRVAPQNLLLISPARVQYWIQPSPTP